jgi:integrase
MICNTAVRDGLLDRNPCQITGAMNPKVKKKVKIPSTVELHAIADKLAADDNSARFKALVLLAGWCGLRYGEVAELRRKDFNSDCSVVSVSRGVTHRQGQCLIGSTKTGESNDQNLWVRRDVAHVSELVDWRSAMPVT